MARSTRNVAFVFLATIIAWAIFLASNRYHKYQEKQAEAIEIQQLLARVPKLKVGMTEQQLSKVLGDPYWHWGFIVPGDSDHVDLFHVTQVQDHPERFLILEFDRAPVIGNPGWYEIDPTTGKRLTLIFQRAKFTDSTRF